mgnify:CR=1 FL=1
MNMNKRPNILIFNPDQMRADAIGHLGNAASITPYLDAFAASEAVSFRNAFCQNPVCVPSRCSFFTGLYPHVRGHRTMGHLLGQNESSLLMELKRAGYYVWSNARNDLVAGEIPGLIEGHVTELYYGGNATPAPGPVREDPRGKMGEKNFYSFFNGRLETDEKSENYTTDDEDVDAVVHRILHPVDERPFCMFLGLMYPHPPYQVEEPYFSAIDRSKLPPRIPADDNAGKAKILKLIRQYQNMQAYTENDWDELRAVYLGMCMKVDAQFKKVCDALKQNGEYDNTAIFFFSDHGDYTGDYGLTEKTQNTFEDCLTNVPLLIKPPKGTEVDPGGTDSLAELVDVYATVMALADIQPDHTHQGRSLLPVLAQRCTPHRAAVFCEGGRLAEERHCSEAVDPCAVGGFRRNIYWPRYAAQWDDEAHAKGVMIRTQDYKYVYRAGARCEFYDLREDPKEQQNRVDWPEYAPLIVQMKERILAWYQNTCDIVPFQTNERFSRRMIWERVKLLCPQGYEDEVKEKIAQGMGLFQAQYYCRDLAKGKSHQ